MCIQSPLRNRFFTGSVFAANVFAGSVLCMLLAHPARAMEKVGSGRIAAATGPGGETVLFYIKKDHTLYRQTERRTEEKTPVLVHWGPATRLAGNVSSVAVVRDSAGGLHWSVTRWIAHRGDRQPAAHLIVKTEDTCRIRSTGGRWQLFYFDDRDHLFCDYEYRPRFWAREYPVRDDTKPVLTMQPLDATPNYKPPVANWHVNDHCFVRYKGKWHMYGIVAPNPGTKGPEVMNYLGAAESTSLTGKTWKAAAPPFYDPVEKGAVLWAPYVLRRDSIFYMFYCAGGDPQQFGIAVRTSTDLAHWSERRILFREGYQARDPMVLWLEAEKKWVLYYASTETNNGGHYVVAFRTSTDLEHWSARSIAYTDLHSGSDYGDTESPFVVKHGQSYYLFTGPRPYDYPTDSLPNHLHPGYAGTDVFRSARWDHFDNAEFVAHLPVHAPEVIRDNAGEWYISHGGMAQGGLFITRLIWNDSLMTK